MQATTFVANCGQTAADSNMTKVPQGLHFQFSGKMYCLATIHLLHKTDK